MRVSFNGKISDVIYKCMEHAAVTVPSALGWKVTSLNNLCFYCGSNGVVNKNHTNKLYKDKYYTLYLNECIIIENEKYPLIKYIDKLLER